MGAGQFVHGADIVPTRRLKSLKSATYVAEYSTDPASAHPLGNRMI
jgi:hypothetical protein